MEVLQQCKHVHKLVCGASEAHASAPTPGQVLEGDALGIAGSSSSGTGTAKKVAEAAANDSLNVLEKVFVVWPEHHSLSFCSHLKRDTCSGGRSSSRQVR